MSSYERWSLVIQAISAIGTVGAVITALFLAMRPPKPNIAVTAGLRTLVNGSKQIRGIDVTAQNIGIREECAELYGFNITRLGRLLQLNKTPSCFITTQNQTGIPGGKSFGSILAPGERATYFMTESQFEEMQLAYFFENLNSNRIPNWIRKTVWYPKLALRFFRCWVQTSRKHSTSAKLEKPLQSFIAEKYQQSITAE